MFSLIKRISSYLAFTLNMCRSNLTSSSYVEKGSTSTKKPFLLFWHIWTFLDMYTQYLQMEYSTSLWFGLQEFFMNLPCKIPSVEWCFEGLFAFYVCFKSLHKVSVGFRCKLWPGRNSLLIFKTFYLDLGIWAKRSTSDSGSLSGRCPHLIFK